MQNSLNDFISKGLILLSKMIKSLYGHDSSIYRDLTTVYKNDNWFVILLSVVYFGDWVNKIYHLSPLKTNNSVQLTTYIGIAAWI